MIYERIYQDFLERAQIPDTKFSTVHGAMADITYPHFCKHVFHNWTPQFPSLRLTTIGFTITRQLYQVWHIRLDDKNEDLMNLPGNVHVTLHRSLRVPYYLNHRDLYVFGAEPAMELEMASRSVRVWAEMFG